MLTLYKKYREKNLSRDDVKAARKGTKQSPAQSLVRAFTELTQRLALADVTAWTDEERQSIQSASDALVAAVDNKLGKTTVAKAKKAKASG
jgi:hypothetical protein